MSKKTIFLIIVAVAVVVLILLAGYLWIRAAKKAGLENALMDALYGKEINDGATRGTLPSLQTNPLENKPDINPVSNSNPITDIKINPFD